jgi:hypothetical protein
MFVASFVLMAGTTALTVIPLSSPVFLHPTILKAIIAMTKK